MGSFCIVGASGRKYGPDEWIECQVRLKAYEEKKRIANKETQKADAGRNDKAAGQSLFAGHPKA